jgi:uncharacterized metal-binding protein YceD (DUF177 family)
MKYTKKEITQHPSEDLMLDFDFAISKEVCEPFVYLNEVSDVHVSGVMRYDEHADVLMVTVNIEGDFQVPCAITFENLIVPFSIDAYEEFNLLKADGESDDQFVKGHSIDLTKWLEDVIILSAPLSVVKDDLTELPSGDGWEIVVDESTLEKPLDPRLAILKDYKPE